LLVLKLNLLVEQTPFRHALRHGYCLRIRKFREVGIYGGGVRWLSTLTKKAVNRAEHVRVIQTYDRASRRSESLVLITPQVYSCLCHSSQTFFCAHGASWLQSKSLAV